MKTKNIILRLILVLFITITPYQNNSLYAYLTDEPTPQTTGRLNDREYFFIGSTLQMAEGSDDLGFAPLLLQQLYNLQKNGKLQTERNFINRMFYVLFKIIKPEWAEFLKSHYLEAANSIDFTTLLKACLLLIKEKDEAFFVSHFSNLEIAEVQEGDILPLQQEVYRLSTIKSWNEIRKKLTRYIPAIITINMALVSSPVIIHLLLNAMPDPTTAFLEAGILLSCFNCTATPLIYSSFNSITQLRKELAQNAEIITPIKEGSYLQGSWENCLILINIQETKDFMRDFFSDEQV